MMETERVFLDYESGAPGPPNCLIWKPFFLQSPPLPVIYSALTRLNKYMVSKDFIAPSIERRTTEVQVAKESQTPICGRS